MCDCTFLALIFGRSLNKSVTKPTVSFLKRGTRHSFRGKGNEEPLGEVFVVVDDWRPLSATVLKV